MPEEEEGRPSGHAAREVRTATEKIKRELEREVFGVGEVKIKALREAYNWVFAKIEEARGQNYNLCQLKEIVLDVLKHIE